MTTRILVTISRTWTDLATAKRVLSTVHDAHPGAVLVHGDNARGDRMLASLWERMGGVCEAHPADWVMHGRRAGLLRNARMVESNPALVIAFIRNTSKGASHTADLAEGAGIPVVRYTQNGGDHG